MPLEIVGDEVGRLDPDREHADLLRVELREGQVEARRAADVVAVREEDDARRAERGAAHLGDGRGERVVDASSLGQLRRLREHGGDRARSVVSGSATVGFAVEEDDRERLARVAAANARAACIAASIEPFMLFEESIRSTVADSVWPTRTRGRRGC